MLAPWFEEQMRKTSKLVQIVDSTHYVWGPELVEVRPQARGQDAVAAVADRLYAEVFAATRRPPSLEGPSAGKDLELGLEAAFGRRWSWCPGWRLTGRAGEHVDLLGPRGERTRARAEDIAPAADGTFRLRWRSGSPSLQPAWYHVRGTTDLLAGREPTTRIYCNVDPSSAVNVATAMACVLNRVHVPFHMKLRTNWMAWHRSDNLVAYVPSVQRKDALLAVAALSGKLQKSVHPEMPLCTMSVLPGVAWADDPGTGESFGRHRCRLLASALARAGVHASPDVVARAVEQTWREEGLHPAEPHRGTADLGPAK